MHFKVIASDLLKLKLLVPLLESCQVTPQILCPVRKLRTSLSPFTKYSRLSDGRPGSSFLELLFIW